LGDKKKGRENPKKNEDRESGSGEGGKALPNLNLLKKQKKKTNKPNQERISGPN